MCVATPRSELTLPADARSAGVAREWARCSACQEHARDVLEEALLLITELVTNAVLHGGPPIILSMNCDGAVLHVRVRDGATAAPAVRAAGPQDEGGRGLTLVELLTSTWGVVPVADNYGAGKAVWFELRR